MARTDEISIGETVGEFEARRGEMSDTIWIKGFKVGDTKVRPWPMPTEDWVRYREHYDAGARRFIPCLGDSSRCILCNSSSDQLSKTSAKVVMPAVDDEGRLQYYKIPGSVLDTMQRREQRNGTVSDRDFIIWRTGSSMTDTRYGADDGEKFKFKFKDVEGEPLPKAEIKKELGAKYREYVEEFGSPVTKTKVKDKVKGKKKDRHQDDEDDFEPVARPAKRASRSADDDDEPVTRKKAAARVAADDDDDDDAPPARSTRKTSATVEKAQSNGSAEDDDETVDTLPEHPSAEDFEKAPTNVVKRWLIGNGVTLEGRQTRTKLVQMAKDFPPF